MDDLEYLNRQVSNLVANEIEKGIKRAIAVVTSETVAQEMDRLARENVRLRNECGICQDALRDIAQETGTPYASTASAALSRVTFMKENR